MSQSIDLVNEQVEQIREVTCRLRRALLEANAARHDAKQLGLDVSVYLNEYGYIMPPVVTMEVGF